MIWLFLALLTALATSLVEVFSKTGLQELDEYVISWTSGLAVLLLLPALWWVGVPGWSLKLGVVWLASGLLNVLALVMYTRPASYPPFDCISTEDFDAGPAASYLPDFGQGGPASAGCGGYFAGRK